MTGIPEALDRAHARLAAAVASSGRTPGSVRLVAVSKFQPASAIREAYAAGQRDFGENYVQELQQKAAELADLSAVRWHMIGHLQRNKARVVASLATLVHTVHSAELARELDKRAAQRSQLRADATDARLSALVEVNVAGEAQKSGCSPEALPEVLNALEQAQHLRLAGLMCVPPLTEDPNGARPFFDALVRLRERHGGAQRLPELSMGMTSDLEHAVAAGATIVRVGTAIFGERPKAGR